MSLHRWIAIASTVIMVGLSFTAPAGSTYRYSFVFLVALAWAAYAARGPLRLHPVHFALLCAALLLHNLGVFGYYRRQFIGLQFDTYVHFYFGFACTFVMSRGLKLSYGIVGWRLWLAVTLGILGFGAIHELVEYFSTLALGPERGMLKNLADDPYDTQKDLLNNLLGAQLSLLISALWNTTRRQPAIRVSPPLVSPRME